jgi:ATP-dependent Lon protease
MPRDKKATATKRQEITRRKKRNESSDDDASSSDDLWISDNEDEEFDIHEYRKFLAKTFPSKYMENKVKEDKKRKHKEDDDEEVNPKRKNKKRVVMSSSEEEDDDEDYEDDEETLSSETLGSQDTDEDDSEYDSEEDRSESDDEDQDIKGKKTGNFNIIFTIGGAKDEEDEEYDDEDFEIDSEAPTENEDDPVSSDPDTEDVKSSSEEEEKHTRRHKGKEKDKKKSKSNKKVKKDKKKAKEDESVLNDLKELLARVGDASSSSASASASSASTSLETGCKKEDSVETVVLETGTKNISEDELIVLLKELETKNKNSELVKECIRLCESKLTEKRRKQEKKIEKTKLRNERIFRRVMRDDKNKNNDFEFFNKMSVEEQTKIIKEIKQINKVTRIEKPYRITLLESTIPVVFKSVAMKKINNLRHMDPGSGEFYKIKNWVDTFMRIPFGKYNTLPVNMEDGVEKCHDFMANAQKTLDQAVYGLNDAKMQIMQMIGQLITNPKAIGSAIAIHGPPGTGKCHTYDTPILMHDGSIKMVQDIVIGDVIMGDDSQGRNVIDLGRGEDELYEVIPKKGEKYGVNSEHILCLKQSGLNRIKKMKLKNGADCFKSMYFNNKTLRIESKRFKFMIDAKEWLEEKRKDENDIIEISVKTYLSLPKNISNNLKCYHVGVEFPEKEVMFDPYIIGIWLGDGTSSKSEITNQDACILHYIRSRIKDYGLNLSHTHGSGYVYRICYDMHQHDTRNNKNKFLEALRDYNLINNKHIPNDFKINSRENRLQLLAGLIDSDGYYSKKDKCYYITQKNKTLAEDILFLVRSLGYMASVKSNKKSCMYKNEKIEGMYEHISIFGDKLTDIPVKCERKKAIERNSNKDTNVSGFEIKPIGYGKYYGFTLDGNHRYLLKDFTVTHNTSLVKEGISKILNRPFAFIALGGATDSSFLEGHSYTYEGSTWGQIVQILIDSKCMNPVIYFDELDKISETPKGEEIAGILTHLTDTSQNSQFHDKYFAEIDFDLSKCLFIFSYNDENKVNPILRDRMYRIQTKGYSQKQKTTITNNYLLPRIREQVKFDKDSVIIPDATIQYIIENHCGHEDGVRNLKRCLEIVHTKLNLYRLMRPGSNLFEEDMSLKVEFPFTVTKDIVDKLIKKKEQDVSLYHLYV